MRRQLALIPAAACLFATTAVSAAPRLAIGLYTPTAPFAGPSERLEFISTIADDLQPVAPGVEVVGRVFSDVQAFTRAVDRQEISFAVIDAPFLAHAKRFNATVLAQAQTQGGSQSAWVLIAASPVRSLRDLQHRRLALPRSGTPASLFATQVLFEGEITPAYFQSISTAPDAHSALTMVKIGRSDAALVPAALPMPERLTVVVRLREIQNPLFVALPGASSAHVNAFKTRVLTISGTRVVTGFSPVPTAPLRSLARAFTRKPLEGIMVLPAASKLSAAPILEDRHFEIPRAVVRARSSAPDSQP